MYNISSYGAMIVDSLRMDAYARALRAAVKPGCVVADIGTGTGVFALLACSYGARRVFAVETNDAISLARELAAANGYGDRIDFFQAASTDVDFAERSDVVVCDLRGILPPFQRSLPSMIDLRQRVLAPGGTLIPARDWLWGAVVEAPELHARVMEPWTGERYGLDMSAAGRLLSNSFYRVAPDAGRVLSEHRCIAAFDYMEIEDVDFSAGTEITITRAGPARGVCLWFDAELGPGATLTNAPGKPPLVYGNAFFPWPDAVEVRPGDSVELNLRADLVGDDYLWSWDSRVRTVGEAPRAHFRQSEFFSELISPETLRKRGAHHVASLNENGRIQRLVLDEMERGARLSEIAGRLAHEFPRRFARWEDALAHVGEISSRFGG